MNEPAPKPPWSKWPPADTPARTRRQRPRRAWTALQAIGTVLCSLTFAHAEPASDDGPGPMEVDDDENEVRQLLESPSEQPGRLSPDPPPPPPAIALALEVQAPVLTGLLVSGVGSLQASGASSAAAPNRASDFRIAAQEEDWERVVTLVDTLPSAERERPAVRYALAVAASLTERCERTVQALQGLELALPVLRQEITELRATCQAEVGPHRAAADYYAQQGTLEGFIKAARALFAGKQADQALQVLNRGLRKLDRRRRGRPKRSEIEARALLAEIAESLGQKALARGEWLWLATEAPTHPQAAEADEHYRRLSGRDLTKQERFSRAKQLSEAGRARAVERELQKLRKAPGAAPPAAEVLSVQAWAFYRGRTRYAEAAALFKSAAALDPVNRPALLYQSAQALSRAQQDGRAIAALKDLIRAYPAGGQAEMARARIGRLHFASGQYDQAEAAYQRYLADYPRGGFVPRAREALTYVDLIAGKNLDRVERDLARLVDQQDSDGERAFLRHLQGLAIEKSGAIDRAAERYATIVEREPLSFAAFMSAARLRALGRPVPAPHGGRVARAPHERGLAANITLPGKAAVLAEAGLLSAAEQAIFEEQDSVRRGLGLDNSDRALCDLYRSFERGWRAMQIGDSVLRRQRPLSTSIPGDDWLWALRCSYPTPFSSMVSSAERRHGLEAALAYSIMRQESAFRASAESPVGARGLMQLMPATARKAGRDLAKGAPSFEPILELHDTNLLKNIEIGIYYLATLLETFRGVVPIAVAAYNAGPHAASRWLVASEKLPLDLWVAVIPYAETRGYVLRVMANWAAYRFLQGEGALPALSLEIPPNLRADSSAY